MHHEARDSAEVSSNSEKKDPGSSVVRPATPSVAEREEKDELDPVGLQKAFKFATWSSVALVRSS